jgi:adenylylsulfate kinase
MIIILTGQPNSGKTTLALTLETFLTKRNRTAVTIDGDKLRDISNNKDYSISGRKSNVSLAIEMAKTSNKLYNYTIVSLVSPFRNLRESLKNDSNHIVKEVHLHSNRIREGKMVDYYEPPLNNYLDIDTDKNTIEQSIKLILDYIQ